MSVGLRKNALPLGTKLRIVAIALLCIALLLSGIWWIWTGWSPARSEYPLQGISVSARHGAIDWPGLRLQNVDFVYILAVSAAQERDAQFSENWSGARSAGLRYGAELDYDPCKPASDQATLFITTVPRDNAALPPSVHLGWRGDCKEQTPGRDAILSELNTLINLIEAHSGKPVLLHITKSFEDRYDISRGINRTLWLDRNYFEPDYATRQWVMWTANDMRLISGISGTVAWNVVAP